MMTTGKPSAKLGNTSMITSGAIHRDGTLLVEFDLAYVFVDAKALTKVPVPDRYRAAFAI